MNLRNTACLVHPGRRSTFLGKIRAFRYFFEPLLAQPDPALEHSKIATFDVKNDVSGAIAAYFSWCGYSFYTPGAILSPLFGFLAGRLWRAPKTLLFSAGTTFGAYIAMLFVTAEAHLSRPGRAFRHFCDMQGPPKVVYKSAQNLVPAEQSALLRISREN